MKVQFCKNKKTELIVAYIWKKWEFVLRHVLDLSREDCLASYQPASVTTLTDDTNKDEINRCLHIDAKYVRYVRQHDITTIPRRARVDTNDSSSNSNF